MDVKNIGISSMPASNLYGQKQIVQRLKLQGNIIQAFWWYYIYTISYRAFNDILKKDRVLYGADEDYVIGDVIPDDWQQRVDNVVGGVEE